MYQYELFSCNTQHRTQYYKIQQQYSLSLLTTRISVNSEHPLRYNLYILQGTQVLTVTVKAKAPIPVAGHGFEFPRGHVCLSSGCCVLSVGGLRAGLITRPEES